MSFLILFTITAILYDVVARRLQDYGPPEPLPPFDPATMEDVDTSSTIPIPPGVVVDCADTSTLQNNVCGVILGEIGADPTQVFCESSITCDANGEVTVTTTVRVTGRGTNPDFDAQTAAAAAATANTADLLTKAAAVPPGPPPGRRRRRRRRRGV